MSPTKLERLVTTLVRRKRHLTISMNEPTLSVQAKLNVIMSPMAFTSCLRISIRAYSEGTRSILTVLSASSFKREKSLLLQERKYGSGVHKRASIPEIDWREEIEGNQATLRNWQIFSSKFVAFCIQVTPAAVQ